MEAPLLPYNEDEFHKEANETGNDKAKACLDTDLCELCTDPRGSWYVAVASISCLFGPALSTY